MSEKKAIKVSIMVSSEKEDIEEEDVKTALQAGLMMLNGNMKSIVEDVVVGVKFESVSLGHELLEKYLGG